jgi:hypothetical protein
MSRRIRRWLLWLSMLGWALVAGACDPSATPTPPPGPDIQAQLTVHATQVEQQEGAGAFEGSTGTTDVAPQTRVRTDRAGNADILVDLLLADGPGASPICFLNTESQAVVLPAGVEGNILLALETGRIVCRNDVDRLNRISLVGAGEIIFTGTAIKVIYDPPETLEVGVAVGSVQYQPDAIAAMERAPIAIRAGEVLLVHLPSGTTRARPAQLDAQNWFNPEDRQVLQRFGIREMPDWLEQDELYPFVPDDLDQEHPEVAPAP